MSAIDRLSGLVRSLAIYHGIPGRQRRLRRFYHQFVTHGDLVFDVGAHAGNRSRAFAALGCRVVALEPQPDFARILRVVCARSPGVTVIESAVGAASGRATLAISERFPTVTTLAAGWRDIRRHEPGFAAVDWNRRVDVEVTTLDVLVSRFGVPAFVKIDVEGAEPIVLAGLSRALPALSLEYLPTALDHVRACVERLEALGSYEFNWSAGESSRLSEETWLDGAALIEALRSEPAQRRPGDVYARLRRSVF